MTKNVQSNIIIFVFINIKTNMSKEYFLGQYQKIKRFKTSDSRYQEYQKEVMDLRSRITENLNKIQGLDETFSDDDERAEMLKTLDDSMNQLIELAKLTEKERDDYMIKKFSALNEKNPGILKLFIDKDIDPSALNHCLDTYVLMQQGLVNGEQAKEMGWNRFNK